MADLDKNCPNIRKSKKTMYDNPSIRKSENTVFI